MRVLLSVLMIGFLWSGFAVQPALAAANVGTAAPEFTAIDSNGTERSLSEFLGKTVVLEWTNHDCPFVRKHYESGNMQALQSEYTAQNVVWLSIVSSAEGKQGHIDGAKANELTETRNASPTAVLLDPTGVIGKAYDAKTTPHMFMINQEGVLVYAGAVDDIPSMRKSTVNQAKNYVRLALDDVLAGRDVQTALTQPYGCSVKY